MFNIISINYQQTVLFKKIQKGIFDQPFNLIEVSSWAFSEKNVVHQKIQWKYESIKLISQLKFILTLNFIN